MTVESTETVSVDVEEAVDIETMAGFSVALRPDREPTPARSTFPVNPLSPLIVIVVVPEEPAWIARDEGVAAIVKPVSWRLTVADREIGPVMPVPDPVTVTV